MKNGFFILMAERKQKVNHTDSGYIISMSSEPDPVPAAVWSEYPSKQTIGICAAGTAVIRRMTVEIVFSTI